jgi:hypothetical protein
MVMVIVVVIVVVVVVVKNDAEKKDTHRRGAHLGLDALDTGEDEDGVSLGCITDLGATLPGEHKEGIESQPNGCKCARGLW